MYDFNKILIERSECIVFQAVRDIDDSNGWIGGNMPQYFSEHIELIEKYKDTYYFYLTLVNPFNPQKMFSIFVPEDYDQLVDSRIYPDCSILLFEHDVSKEGDNIDFTNQNIAKYSISEGTVCSEEEYFKYEEIDADADEADYEGIEDLGGLIKFGGRPELIQHASFYAEELIKDSFQFLFQIDEQGYPKDNNVNFIVGNYPFAFGAVYAYAKIAEDSISEPCMGYWQFS